MSAARALLDSVASIHFPLAREDLVSEFGGKTNALQSTSLLRGKTIPVLLLSPPHDASIHFPLAREDLPSGYWNLITLKLQSTSLLRGKTWFCKGC